MNDTDMKPSCAVIGGGPAGLMAAYFAASSGVAVTLFEKNRECGRKLRITGKGRCNVTNNCTVPEFLENITKNKKFMYSASYSFTPADTIDFFESRGVPLKTERGRRVFPVSDRADDIADALVKTVRTAGVRIIHEKILSLDIRESRIRGIVTQSGNMPFDCVIAATGGLSYPKTGSDGDGFRWAARENIPVSPLSASLVPVITREKTSHIMGLSLRNVTLSVHDKSGERVFLKWERCFSHTSGFPARSCCQPPLT